MNRIILSSLFVAFLSSLPLAAATTQDPPAKKSLSVIEIDKTKHEVIATKELSALKKRLAKEHKEATAAWTKAKKLAKKEKRSFKEPKPKKSKIKTLKSGLKSDEAAAKFLKEYLAKKKKKGRKPSSK